MAVALSPWEIENITVELYNHTLYTHTPSNPLLIGKLIIIKKPRIYYLYSKTLSGFLFFIVSAIDFSLGVCVKCMVP